MARANRQYSLFAPRARPARRALVLWLPGFRLERCGWGADELAALVDSSAGLRVVAVTPAAARRGVRPGERAAGALARLPELELECLDGAADPAGAAEERQDLRALARLLEIVSPEVGALPPAALAADIGGTAGLLGGEGACAQLAAARLREAGHRCVAVVADSVEGALALARWRGRDAVVPAGELGAALAGAPLGCFDAPAALLARLAELGVERAGDLTALPRASVAARFGRAGLALARAAGGAAPPGERLVSGEVEPGEHRVELPSVGRVDVLLAYLEPLVEALSEELCAAEQAAARLRLRLQLDDGGEALIFARPASPRRDPEGLGRLLAARLERERLAAPAVAAGLSAVARCPWTGAQPGLLDRREVAELPGLLGRLEEALGEGALMRPRLEERHRPEEGWSPERFLPRRSAPRDPGLRRARPAMLLRRPQRLCLELDERGAPRRVELDGRWRRVRAAAGPERLSTGWWEDEPLDRDYYRVALAAGQTARCPWIYRDRRDDTWWLHGWFE
jgi:protein ImuB